MTQHPDRDEILARYRFPVDRFQLDSFDALDRGEHVVVAVPTGSGKTVVAEYGIETTRRHGRRAFYTAPIKALSNQKYRDLVEIHGTDAVGLLTGDNSVNGDAPIVVMTTEVLRNMIYGRSEQLRDLGLVVLDEVHFLQDAYRGPVWEEVMIHLPQHVRLICLSATVSNVDELAEWITTVRGPTAAVVERRRPVRLDSEYLVADRDADRLRMLPIFVDGGVNRDAQQLDEAGSRRNPRGRDRGRQGGRPTRRGDSRARRLAPPGRVETVDLLERRSLLPAIYFIFSRAQCDAAATSCADAGVELTSPQERQEIARIVERRLGRLEDDDLDVLGYRQFLAQLELGVAAHHAGMVPPMKEVVEECFVAGLVKVVFATETLAVGINMPARCVVIEKLTKFTGEHHERLTPGQYTQLTGRAGRRGIDEQGTAVVLWSPWVRFDEIAQLVGSSSFHLRSAFRPTYNMAANLIRTYSAPEAHRLLNLSFAQYQADRDVVRLEARLARRRDASRDLREQSASEYGDIDDYRRSQRTADERTTARRSGGDIGRTLAALKPGAVIPVHVGGGRSAAAVVASAQRKRGTQVSVITKAGKLLQLDAGDFEDVPRPIGSIKVPTSFTPNRKDARKEVARRLRKAKLRPVGGHDPAAGDPRPPDHPAADDPDLRAKLRAAAQADRIDREIAEIERRVEGRNQSLAKDFDRVLDVLARFGYVDIDAWTLTNDGDVLARIFHENDLLVAEVVRSGVLDGLGAADVAALVSTLVYEHRSSDAPPPAWFSSGEIRSRWRRIEAISDDLAANERSVGLGEHRAPDPTFAAVAYAWVAGESFAHVVADEELTGGDFVRTMKQLIDVLRQIAQVSPVRSTRSAANEAVAAAFRGVVADSSAPSAPVESVPSPSGPTP